MNLQKKTHDSLQINPDSHKIEISNDMFMWFHAACLSSPGLSKYPSWFSIAWVKRETYKPCKPKTLSERENAIHWYAKPWVKEKTQSTDMQNPEWETDSAIHWNAKPWVREVAQPTELKIDKHEWQQCGAGTSLNLEDVSLNLFPTNFNKLSNDITIFYWTLVSRTPQISQGPSRSLRVSESLSRSLRVSQGLSRSLKVPQGL